MSKVDDQAKKLRKSAPKKLPGSRCSHSEKNAKIVFLPEPPKTKTGSSSAEKRKETSLYPPRVPPPSKRSRLLGEKLGEKAYGGESGSVDYDDQLLLLKISVNRRDGN